jgi:hypothetical protein
MSSVQYVHDLRYIRSMHAIQLGETGSDHFRESCYCMGYLLAEYVGVIPPSPILLRHYDWSVDINKFTYKSSIV